MINIQTLQTEELVSLYSKIIKELKKRKIIRTNNVVGELGEFYAMEIYNSTPNLPNLAPAPIGTENIDAIDRKGKRYSIKSTSTSTTSVFYGLQEKGSTKIDEQSFEYVIICQFDDDYALEHIYQIDWNTFLKHKHWQSRMKAWYLTITKKLILDSKIIY